jgi:hypothetical protein
MTDNAMQRVSFYFSAHEDDWQLFMNPPAFLDVLDGSTKCVFVHMTAGDAGLGTGSGGRRHPYYLARENGAESAIRFMVDSDNQVPAEMAAAAVTLNGHPVRRVSYRNAVAYFLRVPDGSPEGTGYAATGYQSLKRLADGQIGTLSTIDDTTSYRGWSDLVTTLRAMIDFERGRALPVQLHVPELDPTVNPGDHPDHRMTAKAALDAALGLTGVRLVHHVDYASMNLPENLSPQQRAMKCAVFAVTLAGILAFDHPISWQHYDQQFVGRTYYRVEEGSGPLGTD